VPLVLTSSVFYFFPTERIYRILRTNSDYFPKQHWSIDLVFSYEVWAPFLIIDKMDFIFQTLNQSFYLICNHSEHIASGYSPCTAVTTVPIVNQYFPYTKVELKITFHLKSTHISWFRPVDDSDVGHMSAEQFCAIRKHAILVLEFIRANRFIFHAVETSIKHVSKWIKIISNEKTIFKIWLKNYELLTSLSRDSSVGIATGYGLDYGEVGRVPLGSRFSLLHVVETDSGAHPSSYPVGTWALYPEVKGQGREAGHSSPTSAEVKKTWIYTSTLLYVFMA
jgi:hypothetical protein